MNSNTPHTQQALRSVLRSQITHASARAVNEIASDVLRARLVQGRSFSDIKRYT